jgi:hypothetical protein
MSILYVANVKPGLVMVGNNIDDLVDALVTINPHMKPTEADIVGHRLDEGATDDSIDRCGHSDVPVGSESGDGDGLG